MGGFPMRPNTVLAALGAVLATGTLAAPPLARRALDFEQAVAAQKAVEQVFWAHRIWPKDNPGPKPPLAAVLSDEDIRGRVADTLRKSNALEPFWHRPIDPATDTWTPTSVGANA